jgi:hypothetical protein
MSPQARKGLTLLLVAACAVAACANEPEEPSSPPRPLSCIASTFSLKKLEMPEASGAAWVSHVAGDGWLVVADHGNNGRAVLVGVDGSTVAEFELPLDLGAGDDLEGLAWSRAGRLVGITSSGYLRQWTLDTSPPQLAQLAQAISADPQWICDAQDNNCGPNWEGLCLDPAPEPDGCAGFVVSKTLGELVCLRASGASYSLDPSVRIEVTKDGRLSGCDYEPQAPYRLVVAGNDQAQNKLWEITTPRDPEAAQSEKLEIEGTLNQEAIAFGPQGVLLSFGDEETITGEGSAIVSFYCL